MGKPRTYVKHVTVGMENHKDIDSLLDALVLKETNTGGMFKGITSCSDEGLVLFTIVFERIPT